MGTVNDLAYTCDGRRLLGAGADKRLLLWDAGSGQTRHTLTGHTDAVTCVVTSPLDAGGWGWGLGGLEEGARCVRAGWRAGKPSPRWETPLCRL